MEEYARALAALRAEQERVQIELKSAEKVAAEANDRVTTLTDRNRHIATAIQYLGVVVAGEALWGEPE